MTSCAEPEIILDLSRLLSRVLHSTPTGVDRCEMAYARGLLAAVPGRIRFAAVHPIGVYGRLPLDAALRFLDATEERWAHGTPHSDRMTRLSAAATLTRLRPRRIVDRDARRRIYVQASPNNLTRPALIRSILARESARFICLLHDLIPLQYPEYARPDGATLHARRVATLLANAAGLIANSRATLDALRPFLTGMAQPIPTAVAHLGADPPEVPLPPPTGDGRPYFVCIGTIEPRKNHLLLLNLWRQMAAERGPAAVPRLLIIGRRGWENEQVVDMLERCPALVGCVEEMGPLPDRRGQALLAGARALLLPSFAEGYGMPIVEARARGVPVICSNLPALREAGGTAPVYLDPLDGPAWRAAIERVAGSSVGKHELPPIGTLPSWRDHIATLLELMQRCQP